MEAIAEAAKGDLMRRATRASLAVALSLACFKLGAWWVTDSVSVLASLVDSLVDLTASGLTLFAVKVSLQPADHEHRFGYGKFEPLAGLGQAALVGGSAVTLLYSAVQRLRDPQPIQESWAGVAVMVIASVATLFLVRYQRRVIATTGSTAVSADSLHYQTDLLMNAAVVVSLLASTFLGWTLVDPLFGLMVAVLVGRSAWQIGARAVHLLIDSEFPDQERKEIIARAMAHPEVRGVHDLRTRYSGLQSFIQFHLELDGELTLRTAHDIGDAVELEVLQRYPGAEVIIHLDPGFDVRKEYGFEVRG
jgi:ferrous-iron efflux pump FieF